MIEQETVKWIKVGSYEEMSKIASSIFVKQLQNKSNSVLGFATGGSPVGFYKEIVKSYQEGKISFEEVTSFNLDEYVGIPSSSPASYATYMIENLFQHVDVPKESYHLPNGNAINLEEECLRYDKSIEAAGGIDLQLLGIGVNGHIAFNEPGIPFTSLTNIVDLAESTRIENARYFENLEDVPTQAITMGIQSIMNAKKIVLIAFGDKKVAAIERLYRGTITEDFPASQLLKHSNLTVIYGSEG
ncbi:glucosamine-6-phosphate deaminase [Psychrobacillus vulpis]|uniref:Glucosamine-6-phosphate deaminase n=1 Tax=Psychrobacillus vulpis TaxID=2325572 RepID=A0A544TTL2_9BACI|nr:glucosamine-6-phosphate deaminase [Psychrobacillus vulpis]TQR20801.1 glucosamine-6-phosphate deaminase [Psychrobacillus vulpis]